MFGRTEGTTFKGDEVRPFPSGAFTAITRTGGEVVPVGLAYADGDAEHFDEPFAVYAKRLRALPEVRVAIAVGEPFAVGEKNLRAVNRRAQDAVQDLSRAAL